MIAAHEAIRPIEAQGGLVQPAFAKELGGFSIKGITYSVKENGMGGVTAPDTDPQGKVYDTPAAYCMAVVEANPAELTFSIRTSKTGKSTMTARVVTQDSEKAVQDVVDAAGNPTGAHVVTNCADMVTATPMTLRPDLHTKIRTYLDGPERTFDDLVGPSKKYDRRKDHGGLTFPLTRTYDSKKTNRRDVGLETSFTVTPTDAAIQTGVNPGAVEVRARATISKRRH